MRVRVRVRVGVRVRARARYLAAGRREAATVGAVQVQAGQRDTPGVITRELGRRLGVMASEHACRGYTYCAYAYSPWVRARARVGVGVRVRDAP